MKKIVFSILLLAGLSSCSWETSFYIFNCSGKKVRVIYYLESFKKGDYGYNETYLYNFNRDTEINYESLPPQAFLVDSVNKTISIDLAPSNACYFGSVSGNFDENSRHNQNELTENIQKIVIIKDGDTLKVPKNFIAGLFVKTEESHQFGYLLR